MMRSPLQRLMAARATVEAHTQALAAARLEEHSAHLALIAAECAARADTVRPPPSVTVDFEEGWQ
jgi:hypothetical protein